MTPVRWPGHSCISLNIYGFLCTFSPQTEVKHVAPSTRTSLRQQLMRQKELEEQARIQSTTGSYTNTATVNSVAATDFFSGHQQQPQQQFQQHQQHQQQQQQTQQQQLPTITTTAPSASINMPSVSTSTEVPPQILKVR